MNTGLTYLMGCPDFSGLKIEDILQEIFLFLVRVSMTLRMTLVVIVVVSDLRGRRRPDLRLNRTFENLVKLTAVEPDAAAFGAVINFYAGAVSDIQGDVTDWTVHCYRFLSNDNNNVFVLVYFQSVI